MVQMTSQFQAVYSVHNPFEVARVLRNLPEFARSVRSQECEEFVWMVPSDRLRGQNLQPVATVRICGDDLMVECRSGPALRAMEVLIESLVGPHVVRTRKSLSAGT